MLAITLLFANLSKLVAICNILSKYCLCQNRKPFFDLPRQRCAHNCLPTTLHSPHRGEAYSQHCAIVGRPRAVWPLHGGVTFELPGAWRTSGVAFANSRPAPCANSLCGTTKAPCGLNMYSAATFVRCYLVPGASTWQPLQIWSRSAPLCICGNHSPSLSHPTTRPWNTVRHRNSTQSSFNPP